MITAVNEHDRTKPFILVHIPAHAAFRTEVWEGILDEATKLGCPFHMVYQDVLDGKSTSGKCLGLISSSSAPEEILRFPDYPFPVVNITNHDPLDERLAHVIHDDPEIGAMAARHLIRVGYSQLVAVGWEGLRFSNERVKGFLQAASEAGKNTRTILLPPHLLVNNNPERVIEDFRPLLVREMKTQPADAGCFAVTDRMGHLLLDFIMLDFPERLHTTGVIGAENIAPPRWIPGDRPALTSIQTGNRALGRAAIRFALDFVSHPETRSGRHLRRIPPEHVIQRTSTGGHACAHPLAGRAGRWIWEQVACGLPPDLHAVSAYLCMSPRTAERLFNAHHRMGVKTYVLCTQLERARQMLRDSRLDVGEIASACGFTSQSNFGRTFKDHEGSSPGLWRRRHTAPEERESDD